MINDPVLILVSIDTKRNNSDNSLWGNAVDMSNRLISKSCLEKLSELSLKELESVKG